MPASSAGRPISGSGRCSRWPTSWSGSRPGRSTRSRRSGRAGSRSRRRRPASLPGAELAVEVKDEAAGPGPVRQADRGPAAMEGPIGRVGGTGPAHHLDRAREAIAMIVPEPSHGPPRGLADRADGRDQRPGGPAGPLRRHDPAPAARQLRRAVAPERRGGPRPARRAVPRGRPRLRGRPAPARRRPPAEARSARGDRLRGAGRARRPRRVDRRSGQPGTSRTRWGATTPPRFERRDDGPRRFLALIVSHKERPGPDRPVPPDGGPGAGRQGPARRHRDREEDSRDDPDARTDRPRRGMLAVAVLVCLIVLTLIAGAILRVGAAHREEIRSPGAAAPGRMARRGGPAARPRPARTPTPATRARPGTSTPANWARPTPATVTITVERPAGDAKRRTIRARADYPRDPPHRTRRTRRIAITTD